MPMTFLLAAYCAAASVLLVVFFSASKTSRKAVRRATEAIASMNEGNLASVNGEISKKQKGDEAKLLNAVAALARKLASETNERRSVGQGLYSVGSELDQEMEQAASVVGNISAGAKIVHDQVTDQSAGIEETSVTIRRIIENLERQNVAVESQATAVGQTAAAVEQMIANSQTIARNTDQMDGSFGELQTALKDGNEKLSAMIERTTYISKQSERLQEANDVIASIASQTNLLAMNAAIEAAHAGDSGKGFAVVSQEIRKLAESASEQSKEIAATIETIRSGISDLDGFSSVTDRAFASIKERISGISNLENQIKRAMDEQGEGSRHIMDSAGRLRQITSDVRRGSEEMVSGSRAIEAEMSRLIDGSERVGSTVKDIIKNAEHVEIAVETVKEMSRRNKGLSDTLYASVRSYATGETVLRLGYGQSKTNSRHLIAEQFAKWVSDKSGASLRLELFPAEILGTANKMIHDTAQGKQDMVLSAVLEEYEPRFGLIELPFLFDSWQKVGAVLDGEIGMDLAKSLPPKGLRLLAYWENGFRQITNNIRPIRSPQDAAGLRIRTAESAMTARTLEALGAVPVPLPYPKLYGALASGEVDGQENPIANIETSRLYEVQKYLSILNYKYTCIPLIISEAVWNTLSSEHQSIIKEGAIRFAGEHRKMNAEIESAMLDRLGKLGMEVSRPSADPFRAATRVVYEQSAAKYGSDWVDRFVRAAK